MDGITNDRSATQYGATSAAKRVSQSFATTLAGSITAVHNISNGLDVTATDSLTGDLNAALRAYGIQVPPSLRITTANGKLSLDGDYRNNAFQNMLNNRPDLNKRLNGLLSETQGQREGALNAAMAAFGGNSPSASMQDFLDGFAEADKSTAFSIKFNGGDATVEERGENGWGPVQDKGSFMDQLLAAYVKYMAKHGITSETDKTDKKESDADRQLKKALADKAAAA
jgi:hypothetical protein